MSRYLEAEVSQSSSRISTGVLMRVHSVMVETPIFGLPPLLQISFKHGKLTAAALSLPHEDPKPAV